MGTITKPAADNTTMFPAEQCWAAVQARDRSCDGKFYYGVITTGVYCRPSCAARLPLRKNVRFYATPAEAERAGLRPCLRCHPIGADPDAVRLSEICRYIPRHRATGAGGSGGAGRSQPISFSTNLQSRRRNHAEAIPGGFPARAAQKRAARRRRRHRSGIPSRLRFFQPRL